MMEVLLFCIMMGKKKIYILLILSHISLIAYSQLQRGDRTIDVQGEYVEVNPSGGLGLEKVYVFEDLSQSTISYTTSRDRLVNIYSYTNSLADKVAVPDSDIRTNVLGDRVTYTIYNLQDSKGLVLDDGMQLCFWIIDYNQHRPQLTSIMPIESADECDVLKLKVEKSDRLEYRGIAGQVRQIPRCYDVSYDRLTWKEEEKMMVRETIVESGKEIGTEYILEQVPNVDTQFKLEGDQFGKKFGNQEAVVFEKYDAVSVEAYIEAVQDDRDVPNEKKEREGLGSSAPIDIKFIGHSNEPIAAFYTWFIYDKSDMNNPVARYTDKEIDYTFNQYGDYQIILEVANAESTCVDSTSVLVSVTESYLEVPNYFSPGSTPGVNDEFRVAYRSLVKYKCAIFNRWGNKVFESNDPAQGWDGRYKGTLVHPGVYYYSIEATGADGIRYKKGGDINILK